MINPENSDRLEKKVILACDHAGYQLKEKVKAHLDGRGWQIADAGCHSSDSVDYPDLVKPAARRISQGKVPWGVFICGTGLGVSMVANRFKGVRAALCHNIFTAQSARAHNNANVLVLGARVLNAKTALQLVETFFNTPFAGGRHLKRIAKIDGDV